MYKNHESSCTTIPERFFWVFAMNKVTRCSSREVDSTNDNDTLQSQRELLKSFIPQLDSAMGWYDAIYKSLKIRGEGIEGRIARFDGSEREKAGISRDIAALLEEWETFEKNSQMINETLGEYTKELQQLDEGIQTEEEKVVKLTEIGFQRSQKDTNNVRESRE